MGDADEADALPQSQLDEALASARAPLHSFARSLLGDDELAHDAVQETFIDAWQAAHAGRTPFSPPIDPAAIRRWLFHAAYCNAISLRRHDRAGVRRRLVAESNEQTTDELDMPTNARFEDRVAEKLALQSALGALKPADSSAILLAVVHGFSAREIAVRLAISPDAFRQRLARAMRRLRAAYFAQDPPPTTTMGAKTGANAAKASPTSAATTTVNGAIRKEQAPL